MVVAFSLATAMLGVVLLWLARRRALAVRLPMDGARGSSVGELEPGRFRITGRVVPLETTRSGIDGAPCVYVERAEYALVGSRFVPLLREVDHFQRAHPFLLDDGTGRVRIDPTSAYVDAATFESDGGMRLERRLRAGEEVEVVATFVHEGDAPPEGDASPYRASARNVVATIDEPVQISYRTDTRMIVPIDDTVAFLRGMGGLMVVVGAVFAVVGCL